MRFLYKINSSYDGFTPRKIEERLLQGKYLKLGWTKYLDSVRFGNECWIYFNGPHSFTPGVYIKGVVRSVNLEDNEVLLRVREWHPNMPITDQETSQRIAERVSTRYRQVFLWPDEWNVVPNCNVSTCTNEECKNCEKWQSLPIIDATHVNRLNGCAAREIVSAYWIIPNRCYVYKIPKRIMLWTTRATNMFEDFKLGEKAYTYPLALGMHEALRRRNVLDYEAVVPIPLSPDKIAAREFNRTKALATQLASMLGSEMNELLQLSHPISKRRMRNSGYTASEFEAQYSRYLQINGSAADYNRILLVDDVITHGSTIRAATARLLKENPRLEISVVCAGQMIVKAAVANDVGFVE